MVLPGYNVDEKVAVDFMAKILPISRDLKYR